MNNPYLTGNHRPLTEEITAEALTIEGALPAELDGRYLYIGPNPVTPPQPATYNPFTSNGMAYALRLRHGRAEWFRNRWVRSRQVAATLGEPAVGGPVHRLSDDAGTGLVRYGDQVFALADAGVLPTELGEKLETVSRSDFGGALRHGFTSHPQSDPRDGEQHAVSYHPDLSHVEYLVLDAGGRVLRNVPIELPHRPMMHNLSLTERYVVFYDLPVAYDPGLRAAGSRLPYRWYPDNPSRLGVLRRGADPSQIRWFDVDAGFVFHPFNAHETGDRIVLDVVRYPQVFVADSSRVRGNRPMLWRWEIDLAAGTVRQEQRGDCVVEFPAIDETRNGFPCRYGYSVVYHEESTTGLAGHGLARHDLTTGQIQVRDFGPGRAASEGLFVARPGATGEGDGWVLSYVYDAERDATDLVVLNAEDFTGEPTAVVHLPTRVPSGFHGLWAPA
jgi:carotenoid cleavage dioxygenase